MLVLRLRRRTKEMNLRTRTTYVDCVVFAEFEYKRFPVVTTTGSVWLNPIELKNLDPIERTNVSC